MKLLTVVDFCLALFAFLVNPTLSVGNATGFGVCRNNSTCYRSSYSPQPPSAAEGELITDARCFAACVEEVPEYCEECDESFVQSQGEWATVDLDYLTSNCSINQTLQSCQLGCGIAANNSTITLDQCQNYCAQLCSDKCNNQSICDDDDCSVICTNDACTSGCEMGYNIITDNGSEPAVPAAPPSLQVVADADRGGQYMVSLSSITAQYNDSNESDSTLAEDINIYSFILKVESGNRLFFTWQATTNESYLNLEYAACEAVNISFAVVSKHGSSAYSPPVEMCVKGETRYPDRLTKMYFTFKEDFRFLRHVIVNVSWSHPNGYEYLEGYKLGLLSSSDMCGGRFNYTSYYIAKESTSFVISSNSVNDPPVYGCTYSVLLKAMPQMPEVYPLVMQMTPEWKAPNMSLLCSRKYLQNGTITVHVNWILPSVHGVAEAIDSFLVTATLSDIRIQPPHPVERPSYTAVVQQENKMAYSVVIENLLPKLYSHLQYQVIVEAVQNRNFTWRRVPNKVQCFVDSMPEPPSTIPASSITIDKLVFTDYQLSFKYTWSPPLYSNGLIDRYQVRIIADPFKVNDSVHQIFLRTLAQEVQTSGTIFIMDVSPEIKNFTCLFLQIRCYNQLLWSNWSDPVVLTKANISSHSCNMETSSTAVYPSTRTVTVNTITVVGVQTVQPSTTPGIGDEFQPAEPVLFIVAPTLLVAAAISLLVLIILFVIRHQAMKKGRWNATVRSMYEEANRS